MADEKKGSILSTIFWMFLLSILLFWLPSFGPLIVGIVDGKKAGGVGSALIAVFLPGIVLAVALFVFASSLTGIPLIGIIADTRAFILIITQIGPLLIGAIIGGLLA
jgi:hypothetical protein